MNTYTTLEIEREAQKATATIWMNRPQVFNAFDETLIDELHQACLQLQEDNTVHVIVLAGRGKHFSAGADLHWMRRASQATQEENRRDAQKFADMLYTLSHLTKPTVARVQGAALGGGTGLTAACDIAIAAGNAHFATSEAKFGIIPAVISPYVLRAIGARQALRYFQTAERITAQRAYTLGLVHEVVSLEALDNHITELVNALRQCGPTAKQAAKELIEVVTHHPIDKALTTITAERIAKQRATEEAREGFSAFFDKRPPAWLS